MRRLSILFVLLWAAVTAAAQGHPATIGIPDTVNPSGTLHNVYRIDGACPVNTPATTAGMTKLNSSAIAGTVYVDTTPVAGKTYCWFVTAVSAIAESGPNPGAQAVTPDVFRLSSPATISFN